MTKRRLKGFLLVICVLWTMMATACSNKDGTGYLFRYGLLGDPKILDPQLAEDESALTVIENMYCGLFRSTENGKLTPGVASSYTISDDGLSYMFTLNPNFYWVGADKDYKEQVTAQDFAFAFQRVLNQNTHSPYAEDFFGIKNAEQVYNGQLGIEQLGIQAVNDSTLEIQLEYPNANFLYLLSTSAAMPCKQSFFESTKGKYGLETKATIANGAFYLRDWQYDPYGTNNYLILRRNLSYHAVYPVAPSSLNFFIEKKDADIQDSFLTGGLDAIISDGSSKKLFKGGYTVNTYETQSAGLVFNTQSEVFSNIEFRQALSFVIDRNAYNDALSSNANAANAIVPSAVTLLNKSYRELVSENDKSVYNVPLGQELWNNALAKAGKTYLGTVNILVPISFEHSEWLQYITQQWQNQLDFYCGIEPVPDAEYLRRLADGKYDIAFYKLIYAQNSPEAVLNHFVTGRSENTVGYSNAQVDALLEQSERAQNLSDCVKLYSQAEKLIIDDYVYVPLFYGKEYLIYPDTIKDIEFDPFTRQVNFALAKNFD